MTTSVLKMQHSSLQFSDTSSQQEADVRDLFAKGKQYPIKTGTESGPETHNHDALIEFAKEFNHQLVFSREVWVAVDKAIIKSGTVRKDEVFIMKNDDIVGHMHDRTLAYISFTHKDERIGRITAGSIHYATKGSVLGDVNLRVNRVYAARIADWMKQKGMGSGLVFAAGDFNMRDDKLDWAFGHNFTSMGDELNFHPNTGHGSIDGFISYDKDKRVKAKKLEVLDDSEFPQFSDHFVVRGSWTVKHLKV